MIEPSKSSSRPTPSNDAPDHLSSSQAFPKELFPSTPVTGRRLQSATSPAGSTPGDWSLAGFPSTPCRPPAFSGESPYMTPLSPPRGMDDLDALLCHYELPKLVELVARIMSLQEGTGDKAHQAKASTSSDVVDAVTRMQEQLLSSQVSGHLKPMIVRGQYTIIDSLLDDAVAILEKELELCQRRQSDSQQRPISSGSSKKNKDGSSIAVKYSKWQTDILMQWVIDHKENPFPDPADIEELVDKTGLGHSQVINWTTNVRKRNRKATCEDGKKPHHFIDFVFLAVHRDSNKLKPGRGSVATPKHPSKASSTSSASSVGYQTPTSLKKRKAEAMDTPTPPVPTPHHYHHRAYYVPFSTPTHGKPYYPEHGYSPAPHHAYPYGPYPPSPSYHYAYPTPPPTPVSPYPGTPPQHPGPSFAVGLPAKHLSTPSPRRRRTSPVSSVARSSTRKVASAALPSIPEECQPSDAPPVPEVKIKEELSSLAKHIAAPDLPKQALEVKATADSPPSTPMVRIKIEPDTPTTNNNSNNTPFPPCVDLVHDATALDPINVDDIPDSVLLEDFVAFWDVYIKEEDEETQPDTVLSLYPPTSTNSGGQFWLVPSVSTDIQDGSDLGELDLLDNMTNDLKFVTV